MADLLAGKAGPLVDRQTSIGDIDEILHRRDNVPIKGGLIALETLLAFQHPSDPDGPHFGNRDGCQARLVSGLPLQ